MTELLGAAARATAAGEVHALADLTVVIPTRNAVHLLEECLASVVAADPGEVIVVDGDSTDGTVEVARRHGATVLSDGGQGLPVARTLGAAAATTPFVAFIDADIVVPSGALAALLDELRTSGWTALQAGLISRSDDGYWGRALAHHQRTGRSRKWCGVSATIVVRDALGQQPFDLRFVSGEDIDWRWRFRSAGATLAVSETVFVEHRFMPGTFEFARDQWRADGRGLALMVLAHGRRALPLLALPLAGAVRGIGMSARRLDPKWVPYFVCYALFNYAAMAATFGRGVAASRRRGRHALVAWLREELSSPLFHNAYALVANTVLTALLGIGYWALAARLYPARDVGLGSALVATLMLLSGITQLNLTGSLIRFLPRAGRLAVAFVVSAYAAAAGAAAVLSAAFLIAARHWTGLLAGYRGGTLFTLWFGGSVVLWTIFALQDGVLTGLRKAVWVPVENASFGVVKIVLLVALLPVAARLGVYLSWTIPVAASVLPVNWLIFGRIIPRRATRDAEPIADLTLRRITRFVAGDYGGQLFFQASTTVLPLLVVARLGAEANAHFYIAWIVGYSLDLFSINMTSSLTVEAALDEVKLGQYARQIVRRAVQLLLPALLVVLVAARPILSVFGPSYASSGTVLLRLLAVAVVPRWVNVLYITVARLRGRTSRILVLQGSICALVLGLSAALLGPLGIAGIGVAWLVAQSIAAAVVLPSVLRVLAGAPLREAPAGDPCVATSR